MNGVFVVKRNDIIETYTNYDDIPLDFDHLIQFQPEYKDGPHTDEEHEEISLWNDRLQQLMKIERLNQKIKNGNFAR